MDPLKLFVLMLLIVAVGWTQDPPVPVPVEQEPFHKHMFSNDRVRVFLVQIPPGKTTLLHRHDRDYLSVALADAIITSTPLEKPPDQETHTRGEVHMSKAGLVHTVHNSGGAPFRITLIEFTAAQGQVRRLESKSSRYCNSGNTGCVTEKYLFCTDKICVSQVEFGPGAVSEVHRHATAHMLVALNDLEMKDEQPGKPADPRNLKAGEVAYLPAGINHALVNGTKTAKFITIVWR